MVMPTDMPAPPATPVEGGTPVKQIDPAQLVMLAIQFQGIFKRYATDRLPAELRWTKNLRQYLGIYDPEIEAKLPTNRSRAYPRLTRVKCISLLSRLMNLMFPGNERNWELTASPSPEMAPEDVAQAVQDLIAQKTEDGSPPPPMTMDLVDEAVRKLAATQADALSTVVDDQLEELGGDQSSDFIRLNRSVCDSGIKYGLGVLRGPFVRTIQQSGWMMAQPGQGAAPAPPGAPAPGSPPQLSVVPSAQGTAPAPQGAPDPTQAGMPASLPPAPGAAPAPAGPQFVPTTRTIYKPQYEFLPVWDFYPDMSAKKLPGEGYFIRLVMGRAAFRKLAEREDFFGDQVKAAIAQYGNGNYKPQNYENELKAMGVSINAGQPAQSNEGRDKYEIIIWNGPISTQMLRQAGADIPDKYEADDVDAELWMVGNWVVKAAMNPWHKLGVDVKTIHTFVFDEDDTSPVGNGLPAIMRDSQLSVCAATRMTLDNASVVCGPQLEINTALMRPDQDYTSLEAYKNWYRDDDGATAQFPAVRPLNINGHLQELESLIKMFMDFADVETFIGAATGGDMQNMPSEPMRTAAGASMVRGDAALPFKDIVRNYDTFTQSVILSVVLFNREFNPTLAPAGDYNVTARGATSLIAKEVRGAQLDMLAQTLRPEDWDHIDERKFVEQRMASRDLTSVMVTADEAKTAAQARQAAAAAQQQAQQALLQAQTRQTLGAAFKDVTQGQKNTAAADAHTAETALNILSQGAAPGGPGQQTAAA